MSAEKLEQLNNELKRNEGERAESFGLINVYDRIRILTKDQFHFKISSEENMGTSITICINSLLEE
jgi:sensor histidine kinase YesM